MSVFLPKKLPGVYAVTLRKWTEEETGDTSDAGCPARLYLLLQTPHTLEYTLRHPGSYYSQPKNTTL